MNSFWIWNCDMMKCTPEISYCSCRTTCIHTSKYMITCCGV
jgi:hypothetical protein